MSSVVKQEVHRYIRPGETRDPTLRCELRQDFLKFAVIYETEMPHANGMKDVRREGIKLCAIFYKREILVGRVENSREGGVT